MKRAFAYTRVSTEEQARGFSLEGQLFEIREWSKREGIEIVDVFTDHHTGTKLLPARGPG